MTAENTGRQSTGQMSLTQAIGNQAKSSKILAKEKLKKAMENKKLITKVFLKTTILYDSKYGFNSSF